MSDASVAKPHDIAAGEINSWRGRCLDLFAKAEHAVAFALETASDQDASLIVRHLAGHRLADVARLAVGEVKATEKQSKALIAALETWQSVEAKRAFFAHGVATVLLDKHANWHAQFDYTRYQPKSRDRQRWTCSKEEAEQFEQALEEGFSRLSAQLGQLRKRLST